MYASTIVSFQMFGFIQIATLPYLAFPIIQNPIAILEILGIGIALTGVLFASWAKMVMGTSWGRPAQHDKAVQSHLITRGPFTYSRNPIYVGLFLLFVGQQIALQSYALVLAFVFALAIYKAVKTEEILLTKYFRKEYTAYMRRVPRFLYHGTIIIMNIGKMSILARKIHRITLFFILILGLIMMLTGTAMKFPELVPFVDSLQARRTHSIVSTFFSTSFAIMAITGLIMYFTPFLLKISKKTTPENR